MSSAEPNSWIYLGALAFELTEGDVICFCSQYGEVSEISLARDKDTGKSRGFCFLKYEDPRSCELAVDNLHGTTIVGRKLKVSYANNLNAINSRKANYVAPQIESDKQVDVELQREKAAISEARKYESPARKERDGERESDRSRDRGRRERSEVDRKSSHRDHHKSHRHHDREHRHHRSSRSRRHNDSEDDRHHRSHRHRRRKSRSRSRSR